MTCDAAPRAEAILTDLTSGLNFTIPEVDLSGAEFEFPGGVDNPLYKEVTKLTHASLTDGSIEGSGAFDALMRGFKSHLKEEFEKGRITGADYTRAYVELTAAAMAQATQFTLGAEDTFWRAITGQLQGIAARASIEVEKARVISARLEANNLRANYALTTIKLATEDKNYCIADYNLTQMMPMQLQLTTEQAEGARAQTMDTRLDGITAIAGIAGAEKELKAKQGILVEEQTEVQRAQTMDTRMDGTTPISGIAGAEKELKAKQGLLVEEQTEVQRAQTMDTRMDGTTLVAGLAAKQKELTTEQIVLIAEQTEAQRAQTLDTRTDGQTVKGAIGKQKDLHTQQITSYKRDAETKAAKLFTDAWTVQKTIDEGLLAPNGFTNNSLDQVLTAIKTNNDLA